jgi:hypothetical protein
VRGSLYVFIYLSFEFIHRKQQIHTITIISDRNSSAACCPVSFNRLIATLPSLRKKEKSILKTEKQAKQTVNEVTIKGQTNQING